MAKDINTQQQTAIRAEGVSKNFLLPHQRQDSIKQMFTGLLKKGTSLRTTYETQHALRDISFEVKHGEFFGIVGRNGSGKSTLLKILAEIYQPTTGNVTIHGKLVPFIELGVGFNPELTGRENIYLNGAMLGFSKTEMDKRYQSIVEFAELEAFMDQKLKNYSSGMQVRLAFSVAIQADADILLIDEVLAVGDASFQRKCYDYFKKLKRSKKTVVFVTHDMSAVQEFCDRAMLVEEGRVAEEGSVDDVTYQYQNIMFSSKASKKKQGEDNNRNISTVSKIESVATCDKELQEKDTFHIKEDIYVAFRLKCDEAIKNPTFAFSVRNKNGNTIIATNTKVLGVEVGTLKAGENELVFKVDNIFTDDAYQIYASLFDSKMEAILSRVLAAAQFTCFGRDKSTSIALAHPEITKVK